MGKYRTIVADPPWEYRARPETGKADRRVAASDIYSTMPDDQIACLPVRELAAPDAHLYLWVTNARLFDSEPHRIAEAWGFAYKTLLTWNKTGPTGLGSYFRGRTEHVLFCVRGRLPIPPALRQQNIFSAVNGAHSAKPDAFLDLVEKVSPEPRLEMFARRARFGWDYWGDQSLGTAEMPEVAA